MVAKAHAFPRTPTPIYSAASAALLRTARLPAADLSRRVEVELPDPCMDALLFVRRARFAAGATPIVARNYAFLAACFETYEMC